jgi:hypothetical protein
MWRQLKETPMTTHVGAPEETDIRQQIDTAFTHTAAADAKAGALLTAAGLLAAVYTALTVGPGASIPTWLAWMAVAAIAPVVVALVLLLLALRPRLSTGQDPTALIDYGPTAELKPDLVVRRDTVARIAACKYRLIAAAVDFLIGAVVVGAAVVVTALLT